MTFRSVVYRLLGEPMGQPNKPKDAAG